MRDDIEYTEYRNHDGDIEGITNEKGAIIKARFRHKGSRTVRAMIIHFSKLPKVPP